MIISMWDLIFVYGFDVVDRYILLIPDFLNHYSPTSRFIISILLQKERSMNNLLKQEAKKSGMELSTDNLTLIGITARKVLFEPFSLV